MFGEKHRVGKKVFLESADFASVVGIKGPQGSHLHVNSKLRTWMGLKIDLHWHFAMHIIFGSQIFLPFNSTTSLCDKSLFFIPI